MSAKPSVQALCRYMHKKAAKCGKQGQTNAFDVNGKQKAATEAAIGKPAARTATAIFCPDNPNFSTAGAYQKPQPQ